MNKIELTQQQIVIVAGIAIVLLIVGIGTLSYGLSQGGVVPGMERPTPMQAGFDFGDIPEIAITPPPSLEELAVEVRHEYPELADLLENPELGSVYKDFYLAYQSGGDVAAIALARQRGILNDYDQIEMTLVLDTDNSVGLISELEAEGVFIKSYYRHLINIAVPLSLIEEQIKSENPELIAERLTNLEHVIRIEFPKKARIHQRQTIVGQGVHASLANEWHAKDITGKGVKVGILDMGFAGYTDLLGTELPDNVVVATFGDDDDFFEEVHGVACAEIVHEMAPDAELYFAYFDGTDAAMGEAVEWLIEQGVDIVTNSTGSTGTSPLDGTGFSAKLADFAYENGIFFVTSSGNSAENHYRGKFSDTDDDNFHDFLSVDKPYLVFKSYPDVQTHITLTWDDWDDADQDYELHLYDDNGNLLVTSEEPQSGEYGQYPFESIFYEFHDRDYYYLVIENYDGLAREDNTFDLFVEPATLSSKFIVLERSLGSPADAKHAFSVGAVHWYDDALEPYSSRGPTNDGRTKPEITAPSVVDSYTYYPDAFDGTSASTPHVAGAAALILEAFPDSTSDDLAKFLQERSIDLGVSGIDNIYGAGRLNVGVAPDNIGVENAAPPTPPVENAAPPTPIVDMRPTSTPRQSIPPGQEPPELSDDDVLTFIVIVGACFIIIAIVIFAVIVALTVATHGGCLVIGCGAVIAIGIIIFILAVMGGGGT